MNPKNIPMQRKLAIAFALLLTVAAAMIGAVFFQLSEMKTAAELNAESKSIIDHTHVAEKGVIRLNSQMRGVLLTGNADYLEVYRKGWEQFEASVAALGAANLTPEEQALVEKAKTDAAAWRTEFGTPLTEAALDPSRIETARRVVIDSGDRVRVTHITKAVTEIRDMEIERMNVRDAEQASAITASFIALAVGGLILVAAAVFLGVQLSILMVAPVRRMTGAMSVMANGKLDVAIPDTDRKDEVGDMAQAVLSFKEGALARQRQRRRPSDAPRRARDQGHAALQGSGLEAFDVVELPALGTQGIVEEVLTAELRIADVAGARGLELRAQAAEAAVYDRLGPAQALQCLFHVISLNRTRAAPRGRSARPAGAGPASGTGRARRTRRSAAPRARARGAGPGSGAGAPSPGRSAPRNR